jgi:hypoxanthine phosphoribosyltransferase
MSNIYINSKKIKSSIIEIGKQITNDYIGEELIVVGLLKGAFIFMADLIRNININTLYTDFMMVTSFGKNNKRDKEIKIILDLNTPIAGKNVLLVEDIIDTGRTFDKVIKILNSRNPKSLKTCVLLDKSCCREVEVTIDYRCFEIENDFVYGYGLDNCQRSRNIPHILIV